MSLSDGPCGCFYSKDVTDSVSPRDLVTLFYTIDDFDMFAINGFEVSRNVLSKEIKRSPYLTKHKIEILDSPTNDGGVVN